MRRFVTRFWWILLIVVLVALSAFRITQKYDSAKASMAPVEAAQAVAATSAARMTIEEKLDLGGTIAPGSEVFITSKIPGRVVRVLASVGKSVAAGDPLVEIDSAEFAALRAALTQAEIGLADARLTFERFDNLYKQQAISRQQWEGARNGLNLAEAQYQAAKEQIVQAGGMAGGPRGERLVLSAPQDGTVASKSIDPGNLVSPGTPLVSVVDIRRVFARIGVPENAVNKVGPGSKVVVTIDSLGLTREGRVDSVGPAPDPGTRAYPVSVSIDNPSGDIKPGMFAHILLTLGQKADALVVPRDSVVERAGRQVVYVVKPGEPARVEERVIALGLANGRFVEVTGGVAEGEMVVTGGQHLLVDGALVTVKTAGENGAPEGGSQAQ